MIYAQIVKNKNTDSVAQILHFYGEKKEAAKWTNKYSNTKQDPQNKGHHRFPLSFLAEHGFMRTTKNSFYKRTKFTDFLNF